MEVLASLIIVFAFIQFAISLINLVFQQKLLKNIEKDSPLVSILIPARNEEKNIEKTIISLQKQNYRNIEIIIFNDQSIDRTAEIVEKLAKDDNRIMLINSDNLSNGWLGKNYACHMLSTYARGKFLLFMDADVRINGNLLIKIISFVKRYNLGMVSIFPKQILITFWEKISVPNMNFILLTLLPLILVRISKFVSLSAANGQFIFFDSDVYRNTLPHEKFKMSMVEDIEIARYYKKLGIRIACLTSNGEVTCRMYSNLREAINGFSKNILTIFGNSEILAITFWLITTFGFLVEVLFMPIYFFMIYLIIILLTRIFVSITSKQNVILNMLLIIPQQIVLGLIIYKALLNKYRKSWEWKGRKISYFLLYL